MAKIPDTQATDSVPTYLGRGDPAGRFADYLPGVGGQDGRRHHPGGVAARRRRAGRGGRPRRHRRRPPSCTTARTSTSPAPGATTASSRTTPPRFAASRSGASTSITFNADGQAQHIAAALPAAELADVLPPPAARELVAGNALRRALPRRRGLTGHDATSSPISEYLAAPNSVVSAALPP